MTPRSRCLLLLLVVFVTFSASVLAQPATCSDGVRHDDNSFESGAGWLFGTGQYVMKVESAGHLEAVCLCWRRDGSDTSVFFNIKVWAADGPNGGPGTLLGTLPTASATGVGTGATWFRYDLSGLNITSAGSVYIGPQWDASDDDDLFVCVDTNGPTQKDAFGGTSQTAAPSTKLGQVGFFPEYRTLGIRAKFGEVTTGCVASPTSLCLGNGRFRVEATYLTGAGDAGSAKVVKLTDQTGYLWFFNQDNVEAVVKVLDGCGLNDKFWVFAGGLTNVNVVLTVTDTETGNVKTYTNPQGRAFQPIQDTTALSCS